MAVVRTLYVRSLWLSLYPNVFVAYGFRSIDISSRSLTGVHTHWVQYLWLAFGRLVFNVNG